MQKFIDYGSSVDSRIGRTIEISPAVLSWDLGVVPCRKGQSRYLGDVEASMVLLGTWDPDAIRRWCPSVDVSLFEPYARYGLLVKKQLDRVVKLLRKDASSRRAVVVLAKSFGVPPCHSLLQFLVRDGCLNTYVFVRSLDFVKGLPYDARTWSIVASVIASTLRLSRGRLVFFVSSFHVYGTDIPSAIGRKNARLGDVPPLMAARLAAKKFLDGGDPWLAWTTE